MKAYNPIGEKYGRLAVLEFAGVYQSPSRPHRLYKCKCECGNVTIVRLNTLRSGNTRSCGCLLSEKSRERSIKHGLRHTKEYICWMRMKDRCFNKNSKDYKNYGGRGISVCDEWKNDFEQFYKDMGEKPANTSIERIDNNKGYSKDNCKWDNSFNQCRNKRTNVWINFNGKKMILTDLANFLGISRAKLESRLKNNYYQEESQS